MSRSLFSSAVSLIKLGFLIKRECRYGTHIIKKGRSKMAKRKHSVPEYGTITLKRNPVLQNQNYRCRWKAVQFVCHHL